MACIGVTFDSIVEHVKTSCRVIIRNDAHELMSKFNKNSQAETECDTTLSGDVDTVDGGAVNLTNPYGGWSMQDESPDESGVDVNEGETSSISSSNGTFRKITHCTLRYYRSVLSK